jgi:hypothetical protein
MTRAQAIATANDTVSHIESATNAMFWLGERRRLLLRSEAKDNGDERPTAGPAERRIQTLPKRLLEVDPRLHVLFKLRRFRSGKPPCPATSAAIVAVTIARP